ncbi:MAG: PPC domain-containing protein [Spirochaetales bacterium]|jgi:hypothetical protein|nr:PPC domain-containing protein [Spirochaetales bacterium]
MGFICTAAIQAQGLSVVEGAAPASLADIDSEVLKLARPIESRLSALTVAGGQPLRVRVDEFSGGGPRSSFSALWRQTLINALVNLEGRSFTLTLDPATSSVDFILAGEIIEAGPVVRVFTRLVKARDYSLAASWNTDLQKTPLLAQLLAAAVSSADAGRALQEVRRDIYEADSKESPVRFEAGSDWISRTFHSADDEDWFIITAGRDGLLILETSGSRDTLMKLYVSGASSAAEEDDDGGENMNARIEYYAEAGESYTVGIQDYDNAAGEYRFRALLQDAPEDFIDTDSNNSREQALDLDLATGSIRTRFDSSSDNDWYRFTIPGGGGRLRVYTEGGKDTFMTLYDAGGKEIGSDDDSGADNNAALDIRVSAGPVYLCVTEYDHKTGLYALHFSLEK